MAKFVRTKMISTGPIVMRKSSMAHVDTSRLPENEPKRVHARAVKRILDRQSGELVGWSIEPISFTSDVRLTTIGWACANVPRRYIWRGYVTIEDDAEDVV